MLPRRACLRRGFPVFLERSGLSSATPFGPADPVAAADDAIAADDAWPARLSLARTDPAAFALGQSGRATVEYDTIVVGLGAHGSSALYHLANRAAAADGEGDGNGGGRGGPAAGAAGRAGGRGRVLGLESSPIPGHGLASHGGDTRITRQAYFESPLYVPPLRRSAVLTAELERRVGRRLFWRTGALHAGGALYAGALASAREHGVPHEALVAGGGGGIGGGSGGGGGRSRFGSRGGGHFPGSPSSSSSPASRSFDARWPGVRLPAGTPVLWEPGAGVLAPEMMIRAHVAAAVATGRADVLCGEGARAWRRDGRWAVVETEPGGRLFAARRALVLAAGAWMPRLVPALRGLAVPRRYAVAWLGHGGGDSGDAEEEEERDQEADDGARENEAAAGGGGGGSGSAGQRSRHRRRPPAEEHYAFGALPAFLMEEPGTGVPFYGFPAWPHRGVGSGGGINESKKRRAVKIGAFLPSSPDLGAETDPGAAIERAMLPSDEALVRRFADAVLPGLRGGRVEAFSACMFTDTPDAHFIIDRLPPHPQAGGGGGGGGKSGVGGANQEPRVVVCSACSGHGFKLSPAVGEVLSDMALGGDGADGGRRYGDPAVLALHALRRERPGVEEALERLAASGDA